MVIAFIYVQVVINVLIMHLLMAGGSLAYRVVGNVVGRINEVTQRRARLVLGWVTISRWYVTSHMDQLSLAIHAWVGTVSTSKSWDVNRHIVRCISPISVVLQCKLVSG